MKNILVIDDDDFFAIHLEHLLDGSFGIHHEWSGREGLAWAQAHRPDVILLDVEMPEYDGYAVYRMHKGEAASCDLDVGCSLGVSPRRIGGANHTSLRGPDRPACRGSLQAHALVPCAMANPHAAPSAPKNTP